MNNQLIKSGINKISWAMKYMDVLYTLKKELESEKPLKGARIAMSIHLEAKTANLALVLKDMGAEVISTGCNPLSTQDDVAQALATMGIKVFAKRTHDENEYFENLYKTLDQKPNLILDDGADLTTILHTQRMDQLNEIVGACEETTTGLKRMRSLEKEGKLSYPVIAVNDAQMKHLFDNRYGTGQSTWDAIMRNTNLLVAGKNVLVCGYGWCGRGIAMRAKGLGANVIVSEVNPIKAIEAAMDGFRVMNSLEAAKIADIIVTATGNRDVITHEHFKVMKDKVILANAGHFNVEIPFELLEKLAKSKKEVRENVVEYEMEDGKRFYLLAEGRLVNLAAGDGHPVEIMDMSFSIQLLSLIYLWQNRGKLENKVIKVPEEIDMKVARTKLETLGIKIDELTEAQKRYLDSI
ncbi:MAG: adenosylhomocysteinase [Thermotogaceae bacterium]|nr:adenosylhomocysteinase [Thermotogaceae bacterium]MDN5337206.1 adenosylhomocysteinase [Thermotogaceae bacterium]